MPFDLEPDPHIEIPTPVQIDLSMPRVRKFSQRNYHGMVDNYNQAQDQMSLFNDKLEMHKARVGAEFGDKSPLEELPKKRKQDGIR